MKWKVKLRVVEDPRYGVIEVEAESKEKAKEFIEDNLGDAEFEDQITWDDPGFDDPWPEVVSVEAVK